MSLSKTAERRVLKQIDIPPEVRQAFESFLDSAKSAFGSLTDQLVAAVEDGDIRPGETVTIRTQVGEIVQQFREDIVLVAENGAESGANAGVELAKRRHPIEVSFDRPPERVLSEFEDWADEAVNSSLDTLTRDATDLIRGAQEEGLSIPDIADEVQGMMNDRYAEDDAWKAEQLARTGTISPSNAGSHAAYEDASGVVGEEWLDSSDQRVRPSHRRADGQVTAPSTQFVVGGHLARFPADPTLPLSELERCRCTSIPRFADSFSDDELATLEDGGRLDAPQPLT